MKNFITLLLLLGLVSCASTGSKDGQVDIDSLTNEDFKKEAPIPYTKEQDYYKDVKDDYSLALNDETLQLLDDLDNSEEMNKDVLSQISRLCYQKDFNEAFAVADKIYEKYRNNPIYWNQMGTCFYLKKEDRKALLYYNKALEFNSSYVPSLNNIGVMYVRQGEDQKALVAFERAKKGGNFSKTPRFNVGQLYLKYGLSKQALSVFSSLYQMNKNDVDVINGLASAQLMNGDYSSSVKTFKTISSNYQERHYIGINYALALFLDGKKDEAKDVLDDVDNDKLGAWKDYYTKVSSYIGVK